MKHPLSLRSFRFALAIFIVLLPAFGCPSTTIADVSTSSGPHMVRDINTCTENSQPALLAKTDQEIFFLAHQTGLGTSLWSTDGTEAGTSRIITLNAAAEGFGAASSAVWMDGRFYFFTRTGSSPYVYTLWVSDGTAPGTYAVIQPELNMKYPYLSNLVVIGHAFYFLIHDTSYQAETVELWRSDGTHPGTQRVIQKSLPDYSSSVDLVAFQSELYFRATDDQYGDELWQSDGTPQGTHVFIDLNVSGDANPGHFSVSGSHFYFVASSSLGQWAFWQSDGTPEGTIPLPTDTNLSITSPVVELNGIAYFHAFMPGTGTRFFRSDFTASGTWMVTDVPTDIQWLKGSSSLARIGDLLYFSGNNAELWQSDGTETGTVLVKNLHTNDRDYSPANFWDIGNGIFYFGAYDNWGGTLYLWRSDGTEAGTMMVNNAPTPVQSPVWAIQTNRLITASYVRTPCSGVELTRIDEADGQYPKLNLIKDIETRTGDSDIQKMVTHQGRVYFPSGSELWSSDGIESGTQPVMGTDNGKSGVGPYFEAVSAGDWLFFVAFDGGYNYLWRTDGTSSGTIRLTDQQSAKVLEGPHSLAALRTQLAFYFKDAGSETLWMSDGSPDGTLPIYTFPGGLSAVGKPVELNSSLYLFLADAQGIIQLYRSDGTDGGTRLVQAWTAPAGVKPKGLVRAGSQLFFTAWDSEHGQEIWVSDGTPEGTRLYGDLAPGAVSTTVQFLEPLGDGVIVVTAGTDDWTVWKAGISQAGFTELLHVGKFTGYDGNEPIDVLKTGDSLAYFTVNIPTDHVLWRTDGTLAGTVAIKSDVGEFLPVGDQVFFSAADYGHQTELWVSDGTPRGAHFLFDLWPGKDSSTPQSFFYADHRLWFTAEDALHGRELWMYDLQPERCYLPLIKR